MRYTRAESNTPRNEASYRVHVQHGIGGGDAVELKVVRVYVRCNRSGKTRTVLSLRLSRVEADILGQRLRGLA